MAAAPLRPNWDELNETAQAFTCAVHAQETIKGFAADSMEFLCIKCISERNVLTNLAIVNSTNEALDLVKKMRLQSYCFRHEDRLCELFCHSEKQPCCSECISSVCSKGNHKVDQIDRLHAHYVEKLKENVKKFETLPKNQAEMNKKTVDMASRDHHKVNSLCDKFIEIIESRRNDLHTQVDINMDQIKDDLSLMDEDGSMEWTKLLSTVFEKPKGDLLSASLSPEFQDQDKKLATKFRVFDTNYNHLTGDEEISSFPDTRTQRLKAKMENLMDELVRTAKKNFPLVFATRYNAGGVWHPRLAYIFKGDTSRVTALDTETGKQELIEGVNLENTYNIQPSMTYSRYHNKTFFVGGRSNGFANFSSSFAIDQEQKLQHLPDYPSACYDAMLLATPDKFLYAFGGYGPGVLPSVHRILVDDDGGEVNAWEEFPQMPHSAYAGTAGCYCPEMRTPEEYLLYVIISSQYCTDSVSRVLVYNHNVPATVSPFALNSWTPLTHENVPFVVTGALVSGQVSSSKLLILGVGTRERYLLDMEESTMKQLTAWNTVDWHNYYASFGLHDQELTFFAPNAVVKFDFSNEEDYPVIV